MTMTVDANQQRFGSLHFDSMSYPSQPHFTNPWTSSSTGQSGSHGMYMGSQSSNVLPHPHLGLNAMAKPQQQPQQQHQPSPPRHAPSSSMTSYGSIPVTSASADLLSLNRLQHQHPATTGYETAAYTTSASPVSASYATSSPYQLGYAPAPMRGAYAMPESDASRRYSQQQDVQSDDRKRFQDALEASQGMLSMSQETPRNIYDIRRERSSTDSYGFPSAHSTTSSISSAASSMGYYGGSVDGSVSDYSTAGSDIESLSGRTLPRPQGLMSSQPPAPQSMMSSFSSKMVSGTQKKHKCKVCDKRFTRPSSLQTHMYSHTGEKPFACDVEGCGRHFSVVSNLRRHRKVHKGASDGDSSAETPSEAGSEDHMSESDERGD